MDKNKIIIFDTTLRDGEQSPGAILKPDEKLTIAQALEELGVDVIEAGFPISSQGDFKAVQQIAKKLKRPIVCGLARAMEKDIKAAWQSIKEAKKPKIHIFIATSDLHLDCQLKKSREEVLEIIHKQVKLAKSFTPDIEFSPMDATRTNSEFLFKVIEIALDAGATTIKPAAGTRFPCKFCLLKVNKSKYSSLRGKII